MHANIVVLPGDGIGPEVPAAAVAVLRAVAARYGHDFHGASGIHPNQPLPPGDVLDLQPTGSLYLWSAILDGA